MSLMNVVKGLRYSDIHYMMHVLMTASGIVNGPLARLGYKPLGVLDLPLMNIELMSIVSDREGPIVQVFKSNTVLGSVLRGEGPVRRMLSGD